MPRLYGNIRIKETFNSFEHTTAPEIGHVEQFYEIIRGERQESKLNLMRGSRKYTPTLNHR